VSKPLKCPMLNKPCIEHECKFWVHLTGTHPQTGARLDTFDCAMAWTPVLILENARNTVGVQAAVESMRNEVVQRQDQLNNAVALSQREAAKRIGDDQWTAERLPKAT